MRIEHGRKILYRPTDEVGKQLTLDETFLNSYMDLYEIIDGEIKVLTENYKLTDFDDLKKMIRQLGIVSKERYCYFIVGDIYEVIDEEDKKAKVYTFNKSYRMLSQGNSTENKTLRSAHDIRWPEYRRWMEDVVRSYLEAKGFVYNESDEPEKLFWVTRNRRTLYREPKEVYLEENGRKCIHKGKLIDAESGLYKIVEKKYCKLNMHDWEWGVRGLIVYRLRNASDHEAVLIKPDGKDLVVTNYKDSNDVIMQYKDGKLKKLKFIMKDVVNDRTMLEGIENGSRLVIKQASKTIISDLINTRN